MNILVVSRISIPAKDRTLPAWEYARSLGHTITVEHPDSVPSNEKPDAMISMGVSIMEETFAAMKRFPGVPLYAYNWDIYEWIWEPGYEGKKQAYHEVRNQGQQREYDYIRYGELLKQAREVWVPSMCTGYRTNHWYGNTIKWERIRSACPWWEIEQDKIKQGDYIICSLREIPDRNWGMLEKACKELDIRCLFTRDHSSTPQEYHDLVAGCRFIVAPLYELSTGGLTLMEGYYHGKPVLLSNSPYNGGADYFGNRACYFRYDSMESLKFMLRVMYDKTPKVAPDHKEYITSNFSDQKMIDHMLDRIETTR